MTNELVQMFSLAGRRALVTGASRGIGLHVSELLGRAGAAVALAARSVDKLDEAVARMRQSCVRCAAVSMDVSDSPTIPLAISNAEQQLGGPIDLLVNNAGIISSSRFVDAGEEDIRRVLDTNLLGSFLVAQEVARRMAAAGGGAIVNVASTAGLRAGGLLAAYGASKAALIHLTQTMALELAGNGVRVNALAPGNIETDMQSAFDERGLRNALLKRTPLRRFGTVQDLDGPLLLLLSDAGRYMTGTTITVDGGQTLSWM